MSFGGTVRTLALLAVIAVGSACGNGSDGLSRVIGPNPLSDARGVLRAINDDGWTDSDIAAVRGYLAGLGVDDDTAACLVDEFSDRMTADEFSTSTEDDPEILASFESCGLVVP